MDGILSQDEINALLSGMDLSDPVPAESSAPVSSSAQEDLSEIEKDAIGEVANISMGTSATTLYSLVNRKVNITTPKVEISTWDDLVRDYQRPCVFIQIRYTSGLDGSNILILREHDVKVITDLMMGGDGTNVEGELGELHLSAISEAMNQMMGSSATSLSSMLGKVVDISPPEASLVDLSEFKKAEDIASFLTGKFAKISFRMQIGDLVDSTILQLYPIEFAKSLYQIFMNNQITDAIPEASRATHESVPVSTPEISATQETASMPTPPPAPMPQPGMPDPSMYGQPPMGMYAQPPMGMYGQPPMGMYPPPYGMYQQGPAQDVNVQPASFQSFTNPSVAAKQPESMGLIMDVPLEVTVELGRTKKSIADILDFAPGTIIELDKIAGEPIDVLVNGKFVAKGEVVVIEEIFSMRIKEIIK